MYVTDGDGHMALDPIMLQHIPILYAIEIDGVTYDARNLVTQSFHDKQRAVPAWRLPHNRRRLNRAERLCVVLVACHLV